MKVLNTICAVGSAIAILSTGYAQSPGNGGRENRLPSDEHAAWNELNSPRSVKVQVLNQRRSSGGGSQQVRAAAFLEAANDAREFASRFPQSQRVRTARKMEALNLVRAAEAGAVEVEERARSAGLRFRNDAGNDEQDRFQVAAAMVHLEVARKRLSTNEEILAEHERRADDLLAEFPDNPEVYRMYTGIMRNTDRATAARLASKVINMASPGEIKELAQTILDQYELVGTKPDIQFDDVDGSRFDLASLKGKIVVIEVWNGAMGRRVNDVILGDRRSQIALVGLNIDQDDASDSARVSAGATRGPAASYFDRRGMQSPLARLLHVYDAPCVFVLDRAGTVMGSGRLHDLASLLAEAR